MVHKMWVVYVESYEKQGDALLVAAHIERTYPATEGGRRAAKKWMTEEVARLAARSMGTAKEYESGTEIRLWIDGAQRPETFHMVYVAKLVPHMRRDK